MGILYSYANMLMQEMKRKPFEGKLLVLGKQDVYLSWEDLKRVSNQAGVSLKSLPDDEIEINKKYWCAPRGFVTDTTFFKALGFEEVKSMDYSAYEGADYIQDLNQPVGKDYFECFDAIYDGGTCEHIFHIPNFLTSICSMLKIDGRIIHDTPSAGMLDHGFYLISPTLYYDFYKTNGFEINKLSLYRQQKEHMETHLFEEVTYHPGDYDYHKCYLPDNKLYITTCIATKMGAFDTIKVPQQSIWSRTNG